MNCIEYKEFYSVLASNVFTLLSIFIAIIIYFWQIHFQKKEEIERDINNLVQSINHFDDIFDRAVPFVPIRPSSDELDSMIHEVITKYWLWKRGNRKDHGNFLMELNKLQSQIHSDLIHRLDCFSLKDNYNNDYVYVIKADNYEQYMQEVYPYLNKVEGVCTSIIGIIHDNKLNWSEYYKREDYQKNLSNFYNEYWEILLDIRNRSINIDKQMSMYKQNILTSLLDSPASVRWIYLTISLIFIFGILIPFYMIQPNKLGILPCDYVLYIVTFFLIVAITCLYISYLKRYKYKTVTRDTARYR